MRFKPVSLRAPFARVRRTPQRKEIVPPIIHTSYQQYRHPASCAPIRSFTTGAGSVSQELQSSKVGDDPSAIGSWNTVPTLSTSTHHAVDTTITTKTPPLPTTCPGCGALSQGIDQEVAGYYTRSRKAVNVYLRQYAERIQGSTPPLEHQEPKVNLDSSTPPAESEEIDTQIGNVEAGDGISEKTVQAVPICDRCHDLIYNSKGHSIAHPSIESIADSIAESPFDRNHVYHVLDAADFPMSLIPNIFHKLGLAKPRSQNRRSRHKFSSKPTISFIITRSDLLGPSKEMVDSLMPYFQGVLRSAFGKLGSNMRLGNVHLVSAKRGWWTKDIKDSIWNRGGANWMVGKVNVGKSNLFEVLFPKASDERAPVYDELKQDQELRELEPEDDETPPVTMLSETSLLPPPQPEVPFPAMPIVSSLPGTTASPIRLPFGNHKGELIDLPGLARGNLEDYIDADRKLDIVMTHRPNVEQHIIKHGQSLLLGGGLVRITPQLDVNDRSMTMLAYPFVPIDAHVTSTEKAIGVQAQERESGIKSILAENVGKDMTSAGMIGLTTDVTKARAGALLRAGVLASQLPFRVYSTDILLEGVGWVELVCQVRRQRVNAGATSPSPSAGVEEQTSADPPAETVADTSNFAPFAAARPSSTVKKDALTNNTPQEEFPIPQVEIFSPHSKHISQRQPLGAWLLWESGKKQRARGIKHVRPRKSMKGAKKQAKIAKRLAQSTSTTPSAS